MTASLKGKVALVTGGGRGIGRAIALALGRAGAHVVVAARSGDQIAAVAKEITAAGGPACAIAADVADEGSVMNLFTQIVDRLGRLDVLINNAGVGRYGRVAEFSAADIDDLLAVNVRGTFLCCREAMKLMIPHKSGYIINISSVLGFKGYANQAAYTAAKHAVMGLTKSLAVEAQEHGIRVSVVSPGGVDTEMVRRSRPDLDPSILLAPDDIAQAVLYLLSLSDNAAVDQIYIRRRTSAPF
ncbi:MAG: SDR family oxidoreductase [Planctomycetaceae bacterium]|nr:SDR family oxidoreductase [Planctomycetaceae bacterium]